MGRINIAVKKRKPALEPGYVRNVGQQNTDHGKNNMFQ
jgi:hypothetical protein